MTEVSYKHLIITAPIALIVLSLGCNSHVVPEEYGSINEGLLQIDHTPLDDHSMADVIKESGLGELVQKEGLRKDSTYIAGTVAFGHSGTFGGSVIEPGDFNLKEYDTFRIALSICTDSDEKTPDFFEGLSDASVENRRVGSGHHIRAIRDWCGSEVPAHMKFHEHFPCTDDHEGSYRNITLTFKEFDQHCFYLKDVPAGTAYVWFQIGFDGSRNTQVPIIVDFKPVNGKIQRYDFKVHLADLFYSL